MYGLAIIYTGLFYIAPYMQHTCINILIGYTATFIVGVPIFQYMDTHNGWWTQKKLKSSNDSSKKIIPFWETVPTVMCNIIFGSLLSYYYVEYIGKERGFGITNEKNLLIVSYQFLKLFLLFDIIFFIGHYTIHIPPLYRLIHKKHHLTFGDMAITAHYMTFTDYIIETILPFWCSIYIINPCFTTTLIWSVISQINGLITHSGYDFSCLNSPQNHYYHHTKININYGSGGLSKIFEM
jgi:lathosterol oxidase